MRDHRARVLGKGRNMNEKAGGSITQQARDRLYEAISEQARDSIFCKDRDLRYTYANPAMLKFLGARAADVIGKRPGEVFGEEAAAIIEEVDLPVLQGEVVDEVRRLKVGAREFSLHTIQVPIMGDDGEVSGICGIVRDVTERAQFDGLLRLQRDLSRDLCEALDLQDVLERLLDHAMRIEPIDSAGIYLRDPASGFFDLMAHRGLPEEFIRKTSRYAPDSPQILLVMEGKPMFLHYGRIGIRVEEVVQKVGIRSLAAIPLRYEREIIGVLNFASFSSDELSEQTRSTLETISDMIGGAIVRARTQGELVRSREELRHAEKIRVIGQLAGGVAHDFNNQLAGIVGYADFLRVKLPEGSDFEGYVDNILLAAKRASDLTSQLLAFARKGKYLSVPMDVEEIVLEIAGILERTVDKRIRIRCLFGAKRRTVSGDPTQVQNAIMNIALNACDAMRDGGELLMSTFDVRLEERSSAASSRRLAPGDYVVVSVADEGEGMDDEVMGRIFEPFFTTKEPGRGTGMGLASAYGAVRSHNGAIDVDSSPGRGTTVKVFFPLSNEAGALEEAKAEGPTSGDAHVMVVDDENLVLDMARKILATSGYTVTACRDGKEALEIYRDGWAGIDLVLLDMVMPRLSGREVFTEMRRVNPSVRVLLSSGYSIEGEAQAILDSGAAGFIQKPYRMNDLLGKISEILSGAGGGVGQR